MNPKYFVSGALAEKLKLLGFPQDTDYHWEKEDRGWYKILRVLTHRTDELLDQYIAAPHLGELSTWLVRIGASTPASTFFNEELKLWALVMEEKVFDPGISFDSEFEQDVKAKLLIYLAENGMVNFKKLV